MNILLAPLSALYTLVTDIRNWMFDRGWLVEQEYDIPTVCIGNLAVGGTGKTPHTEWLVASLLADGHHVAILSRGYGRKTKGYYEATPSSRADELGDEPLQMYNHFEGKVIVAVCESRRDGIERLTTAHPDLDIIVLDDAFQHRYVRPRVRILLTEYGAPYYNDHVLPAGRLRERRSHARRADVIIVTKCPASLSDRQQQDISDRIAPRKHQRVFFTRMEYAPLDLPPFPGCGTETSPPDTTPQRDTTIQRNTKIVLLAGIAHPEPFKAHFAAQPGYELRSTLFYPDHHNFTERDLHTIDDAAADADYIITTAKDYARLSCLQLHPSTLQKLCVQHINVQVIGDTQSLYNHLLSLSRCKE